MSWGFPENLTLWELLNSEFFSLVVGLLATGVGAWLARNVHSATQEMAENAKSERVQRTLEAMRDQEMEAAEAGFAYVPDDGEGFESADFESAGETEDYYDEARAEIETIKQKIDTKIASIGNARKQRKYQISKYDYREFVYLLAQDGYLKNEQTRQLIGALTSWYMFRNRSAPMPMRVLEKIKSASSVSL